MPPKQAPTLSFSELPGVDVAVRVRQHVYGRDGRGPRHRLHRGGRSRLRRKNRCPGSNPCLQRLVHQVCLIDLLLLWLSFSKLDCLALIAEFDADNLELICSHCSCDLLTAYLASKQTPIRSCLGYRQWIVNQIHLGSETHFSNSGNLCSLRMKSPEGAFWPVLEDSWVSIIEVIWASDG